MSNEHRYCPFSCIGYQNGNTCSMAYVAVDIGGTCVPIANRPDVYTFYKSPRNASTGDRPKQIAKQDQYRCCHLSFSRPTVPGTRGKRPAPIVTAELTNEPALRSPVSAAARRIGVCPSTGIQHGYHDWHPD